MQLSLWIGVSAAMIMAMPTWANDAVTPAGEKCFPATSILEFSEKMERMKPHRKDTLSTEMTAYFVGVETRAVPMTLYAKAGEQRHDFAISTDGEVEEFYDVITTMAGTGDVNVCGKAKDDGKIGLGMGSDVLFKNDSGRYALAELQDGVKDGKSHYKKMMPSAMALFVPKMTHVLVEYDDIDTPPQISAVVDGVEVNTVPVEAFGKVHVISVKALEEMQISELLVGGGDHTLSPTPSIKKMKSLGFGSDDDDG